MVHVPEPMAIASADAEKALESESQATQSADSATNAGPRTWLQHDWDERQLLPGKGTCLAPPLSNSD